MTKTFQTPLRRARGRGPAHEGTGHFRSQRLTSYASILLSVFLLALGACLAGRDYAQARAIVGNPLVATGLIATAAVFIWHMMIGMQIVIEDYVDTPVVRAVLLAANVFFSAFVFILAVVSIGKIAFGA